MSFASPAEPPIAYSRSKRFLEIFKSMSATASLQAVQCQVPFSLSRSVDLVAESRALASDDVAEEAKNFCVRDRVFLPSCDVFACRE